jgi:phosphoglycolate phosphatase-like HAD superfamily hydrolase
MRIFEGYEPLQSSSNGLVRVASKAKLQRTDAILFDCDGVLVDPRESYGRAINATVSYFLSKIYGLKLGSKFPMHELIETLRATGQYNNDIDTTGAILVGIAATLPPEKTSIEQLQQALDSRKLQDRLLRLIKTATQGFVPFSSKAKAAYPYATASVERVLEELAYPGGPTSSLLSRVFNEFYYGRRLLEQLYGVDPVIGCKTGFLDAEKLLVTAEALQSISSLMPKGRIGIVSGRSKLGTEHTLGELARFFQDGPMIFLEDHDIFLGSGDPIEGKPHPQSLLRAVSLLGQCNGVLYAGDSMEDLMMVQKASSECAELTFCAVVGNASRTARSPMFAEGSADAILESVNDLPALLVSVR